MKSEHKRKFIEKTKKDIDQLQNDFVEISKELSSIKERNEDNEKI